MTVCFFKEQSRAVARSAGMGVGKSFSRGGVVDFSRGFQKFYQEGIKVVKLPFTH